jgi:uncharacterized damage-inducible protein DinB
MIDELMPIWRQLGETYDALRGALMEVPEDRLTWKPGPKANTIAAILHHTTLTNCRLAEEMEHRGRGERWDVGESPSREQLMEWLDKSLRRVGETFERMTHEGLRRTCADRWRPLGPELEGPFDARWFAYNMVRHTAYHLGQINVYVLLLEGASDTSACSPLVRDAGEAHT